MTTCVSVGRSLPAGPSPGEIAPGRGAARPDSSVEAIGTAGAIPALCGRSQGRRGSLETGRPVRRDRGRNATERSALLALIQPIGAGYLVPLGDRLPALDTGDTLAGAAKGIEAGGGQPAGGRRSSTKSSCSPDDFTPRSDQPEDAERMLPAAVREGFPDDRRGGPARAGPPVLAQERGPRRRRALEQMILDYPTSALVPQARRLLDQARGAVPKT